MEKRHKPIIKQEHVTIHTCPFCGNDCRYIKDNHGPGSSGYQFWQCKNKECGWQELWGETRLPKEEWI